MPPKKRSLSYSTRTSKRLRQLQAAEATQDQQMIETPEALEQSIPALLREKNTLNRPALTDTPNVNNISSIGQMDRACACTATKFKDEPKGLCCSGGSVLLQSFPEPPPFLLNLLNGTDNRSANFRTNIRSYNNAFQMTSFGHRDGSVTGWNPTVRVQGQVYHLIGTLLPPDGVMPNFLQVYFIDNQTQEISLRGRQNTLDQEIMLHLTAMLHEHNMYVKTLKSAKDTLILKEQQGHTMKVVIREDKRPQQEHARRFNQQQSSEVAILMDNEPTEHRDIILALKNGTLQRISELHRSYDALQYPLIFVCGTDSYNIYITAKNGRKVTQQQFYSFHIQVRPDNHIIKYAGLYQQLLVDWYSKMETERLMYIRREQKALRADNYQDLRDALSANDGDPNNVGQRIILPSSFTGGPRYMFEKQSDAMAFVRKFGCADLFITMTCNPSWKEITDNLLQGQAANDRPDIITRVFKLKHKKLMDLINKKMIFGKIRAWLYSIEYQKRGLPHAHILVWLLPSQKIRPDDIDLAISAEIPHPQNDPDLHAKVMAHMIHGPCGTHNPKSPCMDQQKKKCTKNFPKTFRQTTDLGDDSYPKYRRRHESDGGQCGTLTRRQAQIQITNQWVVPYNPYLLRQFNCHINVELCSSIKSIKYVLKYVHKGTDQAVFQLQQMDTTQAQVRPVVDEISLYQNARYIGSIEAAWRILGFDLHERFPMVQRLAVHLENGQRVYFQPQNATQRAQDPPPSTTLTAFFKLCSEDHFAAGLKYSEVPEHFTWLPTQKKWKRRQRGTAIGRMYTISPRQGECYYLRLLLNVVKGPNSFDDVRTVDGHICTSFRDACHKQGLLEDDNHLNLAMQEAALCQSAKLLRNFFAILLINCNPSNPAALWICFRDHLAEDFLLTFRQNIDETASYSEAIYNQAVCAIEDKLLLLGGRSADHYGMPKADHHTTNRLSREYYQETNYDTEQLSTKANDQLQQLTADQKEVYDSFMTLVADRHKLTSETDNNMMFVDAPGGTGKTFIINLILATIRSTGKIVLATASSGIAATLLQGGRTIHSTFKVPLNVDKQDAPTCGIKRGTNLAKVIQETAAIIIDEAPMTHKAVYEAIDRTLQDITNSPRTMGGIPTLFCGDFRQILPVVPNGTRPNIIQACLKKSYLWQRISVKHLTTNMRAHLSGNPEAASFAELLLEIGSGTIQPTQFPDTIKIPNNLCQFADNLQLLKAAVFPNLHQNSTNSDWLAQRAIISPLNETVNTLNRMLMSEFPGHERVYRSIDTASNDDEAVLYPQEFLNSIDISGLPSHELILKVGAPIIILRSLEPPKTTNGTRCVVTKLHNFLIEAVISCGPYQGEQVLLPRIPLEPSDSPFPFQFRRIQFPIKPAFALTINKSQGQTFSVLGADFTVSCFTHGMFYVAASRTGSAQTLTFLAPNRETRNVVYPEALK